MRYRTPAHWAACSPKWPEGIKSKRRERDEFEREKSVEIKITINRLWPKKQSNRSKPKYQSNWLSPMRHRTPAHWAACSPKWPEGIKSKRSEREEFEREKINLLNLQDGRDCCFGSIFGKCRIRAKFIEETKPVETKAAASRIRRDIDSWISSIVCRGCRSCKIREPKRMVCACHTLLFRGDNQ